MSAIVITGSTGLIGRRVVATLERSGQSLRLLCRKSEAQISHEIVLGDLRDRSVRSELVRNADALVHIGGIAHTEYASAEHVAEIREVNVLATQELFKAARECGVRRAIYFSSAHVYSGQQGVGMTEGSRTSDDSPYARMKLEAEAIVLGLASRDFAVTVLRPCLTYGPGVRYNLFALMRALRGGYYVHPGGADAVRSFVSVDTIAAAVEHVLQRHNESAIYNVADHVPVSLRKWVDELAMCMDVRHPRSVPIGLLRLGSAIGSLASRLGFPSPLTEGSLRKLTASFSLDVSALEKTGFLWPDTTTNVMQQMVDEFYEMTNLGPEGYSPKQAR